MFHELADDPGGTSPAAIEAAYVSALEAVLDEHDIGTAAAETGIERSALSALLDGELPELTLEDAAALLALREDAPDAGTIVALSRDALLMGMTTAVLDVEAVESEIGGELEAREIQSKVEGRYPMTLSEFALLFHHIERRK